MPYRSLFESLKASCASSLREEVRRRDTSYNWTSRIPHPNMVEKVNFFSWERKPLVSSPNLSFLKVNIHFVNEKVVSLSLRERE
jgi:hypothetical protein